MQRVRYSQLRRIATPLALAFVSLITAVVLWVAVTDAENPSRTAVFGGGIEIRAVNIPEGLAVASIREPTVTLRISADENEFRKLTTADFIAEVDLSGIRQPASDQIVIARVAGKKHVDIIEVQPAFVNVVLEPAESRQVAVQTRRIGSLPQGFSLALIETNPTFVRVTGATSLVRLVTSADADVNLTGLRVTLQQQYVLVPRDTRGADIRGVHVEPGNADVRLTVDQQEVTLALTVVPQVQGSVADGYNLVAITSDPPAVPVSGPLEVLQSLTSVTTEAIDVSGLRNDLTRTVRLRLPAGLQSTRDSANVRLKVIPAQGEMTVAVAPQITGVPEGLRASLQTASVNVRLRGELPALRALSPGSVRATVTANGLEEGVHILTPAISAPESAQVAGSDPAQVVVVLRK